MAHVLQRSCTLFADPVPALVACSACPQVEAAIRNGTHYCDIAGEVHFIRKTATSLHGAAAAKNVKVVHACGFDSVPSDLGALLLVEHMRSKLQRAPHAISNLVQEAKGAQSGGSLESVLLQYMLPEDEMKGCEDPFCLNPQKSAQRVPNRYEVDTFGMRYDRGLQCWKYPFQFAPINSRVVRRSAALLDYSDGFQCALHHSTSAACVHARGPHCCVLVRHTRCTLSHAERTQIVLGAQSLLGHNLVRFMLPCESASLCQGQQSHGRVSVAT